MGYIVGGNTFCGDAVNPAFLGWIEMWNCTGPWPAHNSKKSHGIFDSDSLVNSIDWLVKLCEGSQKGFPTQLVKGTPFPNSPVLSGHQHGCRICDSGVNGFTSWWQDKLISTYLVQQEPITSHYTIFTLNVTLWTTITREIEGVMTTYVYWINEFMNRLVGWALLFSYILLLF